MSISIFAQPPHTNVNPAQPFNGQRPRRGHLMRVSSMIRGEQIATRLGARLNPDSDYESDVCVYVKPHIKSFEERDFRGARVYLDIIDGWNLIARMAANAQVGVIACSEQDGSILRACLPNKIAVIPQQHCNFENVTRAREGLTVMGVIGTDGAFWHLPLGLERGLAERGIKLECFSRFFSRQDVIDFYQRIDVQLVWRPYRMRLSNPLKLVNAASFGVPTIAYREDVFRELVDCYIGVTTLDEILSQVDRLKDSNLDLYEAYSGRCLQVAARYHIDRIAEMYRQL